MKRWITTGEQILAADLDTTGFNQTFRVDAQSSPNMTVRVRPGIGYIDDTKVEKTTDTNSAAIVAPITNPRIDLITIDVQGNVAIVTGTEMISPIAPTYPSSKIVLAEVYLRVGATSIKNTDDTSNGYISKDTRPVVQKISSDALFAFFMA